jgi:hypothetical protein
MFQDEINMASRRYINLCICIIGVKYSLHSHADDELTIHRPFFDPWSDLLISGHLSFERVTYAHGSLYSRVVSSKYTRR